VPKFYVGNFNVHIFPFSKNIYHEGENLHTLWFSFGGNFLSHTIGGEGKNNSCIQKS
jgi:hypothetical protein